MGNKAEKGSKGGDTKGKAATSKTNLKGSKASSSSRDFTFRLLTIGDQGVGKTSLVLRFVKDQFEELGTVNHPPSEDHFEKTLQVDGSNVKLRIYDTGGQEGFRTITSSYYQGAHMVLICFDVAYKKSFENVTTWMQEVERYASSKALKALVGLKADSKTREVKEEQAKQFAEQEGLHYIETSAATGLNVASAFEAAAKYIVEANRAGQLPLDDSDEN